MLCLKRVCFFFNNIDKNYDKFQNSHSRSVRSYSKKYIYLANTNA